MRHCWRACTGNYGADSSSLTIRGTAAAAGAHPKPPHVPTLGQLSPICAADPEVDADRLVYYGESLGGAVAIKLATEAPTGRPDRAILLHVNCRHDGGALPVPPRAIAARSRCPTTRWPRSPRCTCRCSSSTATPTRSFPRVRTTAVRGRERAEAAGAGPGAAPTTSTYAATRNCGRPSVSPKTRPHANVSPVRTGSQPIWPGGSGV